MRKKPTKVVIAALERHKNITEWVTSCLKVKRDNPDNQTEFVRERSADWYLGLIAGHNAALEDLLFQQKCYNGFYYLDEKMNPIFGSEGNIIYHPQFAEWRRKYS